VTIVATEPDLALVATVGPATDSGEFVPEFTYVKAFEKGIEEIVNIPSKEAPRPVITTASPTRNA
jgi:hypothetical protein